MCQSRYGLTSNESYAYIPVRRLVPKPLRGLQGNYPLYLLPSLSLPLREAILRRQYAAKYCDFVFEFIVPGLGL